MLVGRRDLRSNNSWMHNLPVLAKGRERCTLLVHPDDAVRYGVTAGAHARVTATSGRTIDVVVAIDDDMMPGVVSLPHGWGHDVSDTRLSVASQRPGANVNVLADDTQRDPLSGNAVLSGIAIELRLAVSPRR